MKNKLVFAAGMAAGYVLGARAGRASYEQIKVKAQELWNNPKVQETVTEATEAVKAKAPEVQAQAEQAVKKAQDAVHRSGNRSGDDEKPKDATDQYKI
ncbi:ElaB/YqjD/DUF883 family membrane-anchored ribosome-binding protein [Arthrobacter pigmenti]|uniref:ElaB/YqjD/DUF883 family membrane-anchored ribosome-binding protein n=1 Tax=Arthrobacter pigmenti TaxID=271432 RepID=A0A846RH49_9MICC|nr:YtxH domain-containing protein [Arthrobacter pigmenti]NJC22568.1 ElaB/YqjD/DUF883 family membrane-anchored ribosome-binding protein [Arthrobacter pigmenti]